MLSSVSILAFASGVAGHGAMVTPAPRSSHNQTFDERNKCGASDPYSTAGMYKGEYCGLGCMGDACLYYQIGCYAGCGTCSLYGKDLYPTPEDIARAPGCKPIAPTLGGGNPEHEYELRTTNKDNASAHGDWSAVNPWRAPGTAGMGNANFPPCGVNSGSSDAFPNPPTTAKDVPKAGPGTALAPLDGGSTATWKRGTVAEASWAIYANHGGGYSYRLCKKGAPGEAPTEACFQQTPLDFVGNTTTIRYADGSKQPFEIAAVTTNVGTHPAGSMWRRNPVPMCNCDVGISCGPKGPADWTMYTAYPKTHFKPGETSDICPTGVQYEAQWPEGMGASGQKAAKFGSFMFEMVDQVQVPSAIEAGDYTLSWRWDCEETPQVWASCADITIQ